MNPVSLLKGIAIIIFLAILNNHVVIGQETVKIDTSNYTTIRIDPENASGGSASDIFEHINYIPLETKSESLFGEIYQLVVTENYFVILDYDTNSILIFEKTGKYHAKIEARKDNPKSRILKFSIIPQVDQIAYLTDEFKTIVRCDFNGKILKVENNFDKSKNPNYLRRGFYLPSSRYISYVPYYNNREDGKQFAGQKSALIQYLKDDGTTYKIALPYTSNEQNIDVVNSGIGPLTKYGNDTTFLFSKPYDFTLYTITPSSVKLSYKLLFPLSSSLPIDFVKRRDLDGKRQEFIQKNRMTIFGLTNCYQIGYNLLVKANSYRARKNDNLIYNIKSGTLLAFKQITPDAQNYYLPLYDDLSSTFENIGIAACDGKFIYTSISSAALFKAKEESPDKKVTYDKALSTYFMNSNKTSNPVIIQMKLTEKL